MKVYVNVEGKWIAIPCSDRAEKISSLIDGAIKRGKEAGIDIKSQEYTLTSSNSEILYNRNDAIGDVIDDGQFLRMCNPKLMINKDAGDCNGSKSLHPVINHLAETVIKICTRGLSTVSLPEHHQLQKSLNEEENVQTTTVILNGDSLTTETLWLVSKFSTKIKISNESMLLVSQSRKLLDEIVEQNKVVYAVNTGFGKFARVVIPRDELEELQINVIEADCVGVGKPLSPERTRMMLALRINVLCKGYSGIAPRNLKILEQACNALCLPWIPEKGTVGASGDLAPLAHMALGFMGKGKMWSPESGWAEASHVMEAHGIETLQLAPKDGVSLINGTQFMAALGAEAVERAKNIALQADVVAAMTLEALQGTSRAFDEAIHSARPHKGQQAVASRLRKLLNYGGEASEITEKHRNCDRVQDAYTLRCCPQVHGVVNDTIAFVKSILDVELNSATDNPMVLIDRWETISGGNFHGEYPAKALDYLAIGVHELASISERRIERLCNPAYSGLPAFLVERGGLNTGFMMAHCTAAALVSENKVLCHPSSVDSISTSAGQEDHVSMGGWAARKALEVVNHVEYVIAIELLCACQGIEFHRPLRSTHALEVVHSLVRSVAKRYDKDRVHSPDIEAVAKLLRDNAIWKAVESNINQPLQPGSYKYSSSPTSSMLPNYIPQEH